MVILSADTTAKTASVCVSKLENGVLAPLADASVHATLTHSESLLPMIDFCLRGASLTFSDVDALAMSAGPGSFTGVRIGVACFKGLAFPRPTLPVVGVSTLEALAYNLAGYPANTVAFPVMDARREQFYNAAFSLARSGAVKRLCPDRVLDFASLAADLKKSFANKKIVLCGDGAHLFFDLYAKSGENGLALRLAEEHDLPQNAFSVARAALPVLMSAAPEKLAETYTAAAFSPVYLRRSQAEREREAKLS